MGAGAGVTRGAIAAAVGCAAAQMVGFWDLRHDDAFITYRYGQNLARGLGLVFNPGERVMGSTSPGHALASGLVYLFADRDATPTVMACLGCAAWALAALATFVVLRRTTSLAVAAFTAALLAAGASNAGETVTLETTWALAASLGAVAAAVHGRDVLAVALAAGATWMRPDAALAAVSIAPLVARRGLRRAALLGAVYLGLVAPWFVFAKIYYGDALPQSFRAKLVVASAREYAAHLYRYVPTVVLPYAPPPVGWLAVVSGWGLLVRRDARLWTLAAWNALHLGAYAAMHPGIGYNWHLQPTTWLAVVGAWGGLAVLAERIPWRVGRAVAAAALVAVVGLRAADTARFARATSEYLWFGQRDKVYRELAAHLAASSAPGDVVSTEEVGTIAYYSDLPMSDRTGLVSRDRMGPIQKWLAGDATALRWLVLRKPELEAARPVYGARTPRVFRHDQIRVFVFDLSAPPAP